MVTNSPLFFQERIKPGLSNLLVNLRLCSAGGDPTEDLAIHPNGQAPLVGEKLRKSKVFHIAFLDRFRSFS